MSAISARWALAPAAILSGLMTHAGGWAVITVDDLPDYAVVGKPLALTYSVRQHGHTLLDDLGSRGTIEARSGRTTINAQADRIRRPGSYGASIVLPSAGDWTITIKSGFGNSNLTLLPLTVVTDGSRLTRPITDQERGERLFTSKGCVTCHVQIQVGPSLDGKRFDPAYIARFLADPSIAPPRADGMTMPKLGLAQPEIASLVTYLNSDRQISAR